MRQAYRISIRTALLALILAVAATLIGCDRKIGYGVLLWSPDEDQISSGSVVSVLSESDIQDTYGIRDEETSTEATVDRWRVRFFETEEEAQSEAAAYAELATVYARSGRNALPMRSAPEIKDDNIVYRLRDGEVIKIIDRAEEETNLSGLVSYWYTALTDTGIQAHVFGYELQLFDPTDPSADFATSGSTDPLIQLLLDNVWRPVYFVDMIANGTYDLDLFQEKYGLFPNPDENTLKLVLPYHTIDFTYDALTNVGPRKYLAEGTSLQMTFNRGDELSLQYVYEDRQYILAMQRVDGNIQDYVDAELERRDAIYQELLDRGPVFTSGSYGRITLLEDNEFIWTGYERLVPAAIPDGLGTTGKVILDLYLSSQLTANYDGVVSFKFDGAPSPVTFIYALVPDGIRMVYVPETDIDEYVVTGSGVSSITLFFSASGS